MLLRFSMRANRIVGCPKLAATWKSECPWVLNISDSSNSCVSRIFLSRLSLFSSTPFQISLLLGWSYADVMGIYFLSASEYLSISFIKKPWSCTDSSKSNSFIASSSNCNFPSSITSFSKQFKIFCLFFTVFCCFCFFFL